MDENKSKFINPLTDFGFKLIFGRENNKEFLISFLNSIFSEEDEIIDISFIDKEHSRQHKNARALIYDVHCITSSGKKFIVEMQNRYQTYFRDRALYYLSADILQQGRMGDDWDYQLVPVYGVFLMNFNWKEFGNEFVREDVGLVNLSTNQLFSDKLRMVFIKLPLLTKSAEECTTILDRWLYILKNLENMERLPYSFRDNEVFLHLDRVARVAALSDNDRSAYDHSLKVYRDNFAIAQTERTEGFIEGMTKAKLDGARNFLKAGVSPEMVAKCMGLPIEQVMGITFEP